MSKVLNESFFARPAPIVAEDLIGKFLVREMEGKLVRSTITETEAYEGCDDLASHASKGRTPRTDVMFGKPGILYVYFIYGMYSMLNIVTGSEGFPSGVLIRGTDRVSGPGRLTRTLEITRALNTLPATKDTGLWFEDSEIRIPTENILRTPRIGVDYAGPIWSQKPWRYVFSLSKNNVH